MTWSSSLVDTPWATLVAVLSASVVGSLHCVGMCGPFVAVYAAASQKSELGPRHRGWIPHVAYHGGRGLTYVGLGAAGGAMGAAVDFAGSAAGIVQLAAVISGVLVILWGLSVWFPRLAFRSPLDGMLGRRLVQLRTQPRVVRASLLGVFTPLLPCGWLYAFVVTAAGTGSVTSGGLVMTAFWLGTIPGLLGAGALFSALGQRLRRRLPLLTGAALIVVGLTGVVSRMSRPLPGPSADAHAAERPKCH